MKLTHLLPVLGATAALLLPTAHAFTMLGTGTGALLGGDLTDPENDGAADANVNYNAIFDSKTESGFGGGEFAFNVFDNIVARGNAKWCCEPAPQWVQATFANTVTLTHFTLTSSNDSSPRDPKNWEIQGSSDGVNFTTIHSASSAPWTARNQVILWDSADGDFAMPAVGYHTIRLSVNSVRSGSNFALGEFEIFGVVPSGGSTLPMLLSGVAGLIVLRSKRRK